MSKRSVFINEIHYCNFGKDKYEGVEIAGPAGTNLKGWSLHFYNKGSVYDSIDLTGVIPSHKNEFGTLFFAKAGIVDASGGIALVDKNKNVVLFVSYDKSFTAVDGPASGQQSELLPVSEGFFASVDDSLQLIGTGSYYEDFKWVTQHRSSGAVNRGQTFVALPRTQPRPTPTPTPEPTPTPAEDKPPVVASPTTNAVVNNVDFLKKQNRTAHHTDAYTSETLIIRRGQSFEIQVTGDHVEQANVELLFTVHPEEELITVPVKGDGADFSAKFTGAGRISVNVPGTIAVGQYSIDIKVNDHLVTAVPEPLIILFNPWASSDAVFLDNDSHRNEYVLNEQGLLWRGSAGNNGPCNWNFAQFQHKVLLSALRLLEAIPLAERGNVAVVSRKLTVLENDRVLIGNWSGKYDGGKPPTAWTGSKEILLQFYETNRPVKFGQCWVFSGILTTLTRTLGIPSRSVTNFESAHDTNANRVVDKFFTADGNIDDEKTNDSVWNFHVWNDAWMARPDIADNRFSGPGWQAIDATPQEKSEGEYQTGPCPLSAIKAGVEVPHDWKFISGEVNADVRYYVKGKDGSYKLTRTETASVGKEMSTKAIGKFERYDVTLEYKFAEGSKDERAAFGAEEANKDLVVLGRFEVDEIPVGKNVPVNIVLSATKSFGEEEKSIKVVFKASAVSYTGKPIGVIQNSEHQINVPGDGSERSFSTEIAVDSYIQFAKNDFFIDLQMFIYSDADADVDSVISKRVTLRDPAVTIDAPEAIPSDGQGKVTISFVNPLPIPLTNVVFTIEGSGLTGRLSSKGTTVAPGEGGSTTFALKEKKKAGERVLKVLVTSNELETLTTSKHIVVN